MNNRPKRNLRPSLVLKDFVVLSDQEKSNKLKFSSDYRSIDNERGLNLCILKKKYINERKENDSAFYIKPFNCSKCPLKFSVKADLKIHFKSHKHANSYLCEDCGKSLSSLQSFTEHVNIHRNLKPFKCEHCGHESRQFSVHYRHCLTHNKDPSNNYKCSICHKSFKLKEYLKRHVVKHLNIAEKNIHKCDVCNKTFREKRELKRHKVSHSSIRRFSCSYCSKSFKMQHNLQAHLKPHIGLQTTLNCNLCSAKFSQQRVLEAHKKSHKELIQNIELIKVDSRTIHVITFPLDRRKIPQTQKVYLPQDFSLENQEQLKKSKLSLCLDDVVFPISVVANSFGTGTHIKVKIIDPKPQSMDKLKPIFKAYIAEKESQFQEGESSNNVFLEQISFNLPQEPIISTLEETDVKFTNDEQIESKMEDKFEKQMKTFEEKFILKKEDCVNDLEAITNFIVSFYEPFSEALCVTLSKIISILQIHLVKCNFLKKSLLDSKSENETEILSGSDAKAPPLNEIDSQKATKLDQTNGTRTELLYSNENIKLFKKCYRTLLDALHKNIKLMNL